MHSIILKKTLLNLFIALIVYSIFTTFLFHYIEKGSVALQEFGQYADWTLIITTSSILFYKVLSEKMRLSREPYVFLVISAMALMYLLSWVKAQRSAFPMDGSEGYHILYHSIISGVMYALYLSLIDWGMMRLNATKLNQNWRFLLLIPFLNFIFILALFFFSNKEK